MCHDANNNKTAYKTRRGQQAEPQPQKQQLVAGARESLIFWTFEYFARHLATLLRRTNVMQIVALTRSHCIRRQPCRIHTCMCFIFHNRNFFRCCFCCAHSHVHKRSTAQYTHAHYTTDTAASLALPAWLPAALSCCYCCCCCCRRRFTQCCVVITAFALCYIFSLSFVQFALHSHTRIHTCMRAG